ncbi:hypothetical protein BGZ65_011300, partial [Modicella reniformis]
IISFKSTRNVMLTDNNPERAPISVQEHERRSPSLHLSHLQSTAVGLKRLLPPELLSRELMTITRFSLETGEATQLVRTAP